MLRYNNVDRMFENGEICPSQIPEVFCLLIKSVLMLEQLDLLFFYSSFKII